jgi:GNAT superfamily N-acetyltransferase
MRKLHFSFYLTCLFCSVVTSSFSSQKTDFPSRTYSGKPIRKFELSTVKIASADTLSKGKRISAIRKINQQVGWASNTKSVFQLVDAHLETTFFALYGKEVIGYAILNPEKNLLSNLAIHPDFQNKGVGSLILESVLKKALECNLTSLNWNYRSKNEKLKKFYEKFLLHHSYHYSIKEDTPYIDGDSKKLVTMDLTKVSWLEK